MKTSLDKICYQHNFISKAIFRIDFNDIFILQEKPPSEFQESVKKDFPKTKNLKRSIISSRIDSKSGSISRQEFPIYVFSTQDDSVSVDLAYNYLGFTIFKYVSFENFLEKVETVLNHFLVIYKPITITRIGLRYINEIKIKTGNPLEWKELLNKKMISNFDTKDINLRRCMTQSIYMINENLLQFNYGLFNSEFPSNIARKEYILDLDCSTNECTEKIILDKMKGFHKIIQQYFEMAITKKLREQMGNAKK